MNAIKTHPVKSSQIEAIGHDSHTNTLAITFKSKAKDGQVKLETYHYANFSKYEYDRLRTAESIGKHFYAHIKPHADKYPYTKQKSDTTIKS